MYVPRTARRRQRGTAQLEAAWLLTALFAAGLLGSAELGRAFERAIGADARGATPSAGDEITAAPSHGAPALTAAPPTAQAGLASAAADLSFAARLPARGSAEYARIVVDIERALARGAGDGFALVRLQEFLPASARDAFGALKEGKRTLDYDPHRANNHLLFGAQAAGLAHYHRFIDDLLFDATKQRLPQRTLHVQLEGARRASDFGWHVDGAPITTLLLLGGDGTEFVPFARGEARTLAGAETLTRELAAGAHRQRGMQTRPGDLLVFVGRGSQNPRSASFGTTFRDLPPLVHRAPNGTDQARALLIHRFDLPAFPGSRR